MEYKLPIETSLPSHACCTIPFTETQKIWGNLWLSIWASRKNMVSCHHVVTTTINISTSCISGHYFIHFNWRMNSRRINKLWNMGKLVPKRQEKIMVSTSFNSTALFQTITVSFNLILSKHLASSLFVSCHSFLDAPSSKGLRNLI